MTHFAFFLSKKDSRDPRKKGFAYAIKHKDKWVNIQNICEEINTYDKGTTCLCYNGIAYDIYKDYVNIDDSYRVYICCDLGLDLNNIEKINEIFPD